MDPADELRVLLARLHAVEVVLIGLGDRISVLEIQTINHENRLQQIEENCDKDAYIEK